MAKIEELKVGQPVTCRGRAGVLMTVDRPTEQVVVRFDVQKPPAVSSDGVEQTQLPDVTVLASEVNVEPPPFTAVPAPTKPAPTKSQVAAVRSAALVAGKKEGLKGDDLVVVQDEAEAELTSKAAGNRPA